MDLLATGNTVKPGLPARNGDAASEGEKSDESATFEVFLDLALTVPSPDVVNVPGPEGKPAPGDGLDALLETTGKAAMPPGNILPVDLPLGLEAIDGAPGAAARSDNAFAATTLLAIPVIAQPTVEARSEAPVADHQALPTPAPVTLIDAEPVASEPALTKALELLPRAAVASQPAQAAQSPLVQPAQPQATSPQNLVALAITVAQTATPVVSVLAGRHQRAAEPARPAPAPDGIGLAAPLPAGPITAVQPAASVMAALPDSERLPSPPQAPAADARAPADTADAKAKPMLPDPATFPQPASAVSLAEPIAPVSDARTGLTAPPSGSATAATAPSQSAARDFGQIVDRLARAREAEQPQFVQSTLTTRDFGTVSMQLRPIEGRLHVAMTSADPGFAPAVQAASAMSGTGQQALSEGPAQQQQQSQSAQQSGQGQSAPDSQARRQQWEREMQAASRQGQSAPSGDNANSSASGRPGTASSGMIYA